MSRQGNSFADQRRRSERSAADGADDWSDESIRTADERLSRRARRDRVDEPPADEPVDRILTSLDRLGERIRSMTPDRRANRVEKPAAPRSRPNPGIELQRAIDQISSRRDSLEQTAREDRRPRAPVAEEPPRYPAAREPLREVPRERAAFTEARPALPALDDVRNDLRELRRSVDRMSEPREEQTRQFRDLSDRIERASRTQVDPAVIQRMREEIGHLRGTVQAALDATPLSALESSYSDVVRRLDDMRDAIDNPRMIGDLVQRLADIRRLLAQAPTENHLLSISDRIDDLASRIDQGIGGNLSAVRDLDQQVATVAKAVASIDQGAIARAIETRLVDVIGQIATLEERLGRLDALDRFSENFDRQASALSQIVQRSDQLPRVAFEMERQTAAFGDLARSVEALPRLESDLAAVKRSLDSETAVSSRALEALVNRIDALAARVETGDKAVTEAGLDTRLGEIMARLDRFDGSVDPAGMDRLQAHFARLAQTIESRLPAIGASRVAELPPELIASINRIEEHLARGDDTASLARLEDRIDLLTRHIEKASRTSSPDLGIIEDNIAALRDDMAASLRSPLTDIDKELRLVTDRLEKLRIPDLKPEAFERLEKRLTALAEGLDDRLGDLIQRIESGPGTSGELVSMLARLERTVNDVMSPEKIAASAARAAVNAVSDRNDFGEMTELMAGLRRDFIAMQDDLRKAKSRDRDLLVTISETLEKLASREPEVRYVPQPLAEGPAPRVQLPGSDAATWKEIERSLSEGLAPRARAPEPEPVMAPPPAAIVEDEDEDTDGLQEIINRRLASRKRKSEPAPDVRVEPALSQEPAFDENQPLEPGSGKPAPRAQSRASEAPKTPEPETPRKVETKAAAVEPARGEPTKADFIAAARRAAQAAGAEPTSSRRNSAKPEAAKSEKTGRGIALPGFIKQHKRQLLMAAAAVLVVLGSTRLVINMLFHGDSEPVIEQSAIPAEEAVITPTAEVVPEAGAPATEAPEGETATIEAAPDSAVPTVEMETPAEMPDATAMLPPVAPDGVPATPPVAPTEPSVTNSTSPAALPDAAATSLEPMGPAGSFTANPQTPAPEKFATDSEKAGLPPAGIGSLALREAAAGGDPVAQFEVAARFSEGRGVAQDLGEAIAWYQKSADAGLPPAQYRLGSLYEKGQGVARDPKKAAEWYMKAADAGNAKAMHNLAVLNAEGGLGNPDYAAAGKWFEQAADYGIRDSQYNLGILYARGLGVPRDLTMSYKWFAIAANAGDSDAAKKRDDVAQVLDKDLLAKARLAVETWKAKPSDPAVNDVVITDPSWQSMPDETSAAIGSGEDQVMKAQQLLAQLGFDPGPADGKMGKRTRDAIAAFQKARGLPETGEVSAELVTALSETAI